MVFTICGPKWIMNQSAGENGSHFKTQLFTTSNPIPHTFQIKPGIKQKNCDWKLVGLNMRAIFLADRQYVEAKIKNIDNLST